MEIHKIRLARIVSGMKQRCYNSNAPQYKWYGAKGIRLCDDWLGKDGLSSCAVKPLSLDMGSVKIETTT